MPKWLAIIAMPLAVLVVLYVAVGFGVSLLLEKWRFRRRWFTAHKVRTPTQSKK